MAWWCKYPRHQQAWYEHAYQSSLHRILFCVPGDINVSETAMVSLWLQVECRLERYASCHFLGSLGLGLPTQYACRPIWPRRRNGEEASPFRDLFPLDTEMNFTNKWFLFNFIENSPDCIQWRVIDSLVILIAQSFVTYWKYFPVTPHDNWITFPVSNRGYLW